MEVVIVAILATALAERSSADAWFTGSLFSGLRARAEAYRDDGGWAASRLLGELFTCRFCLGYHLTFWLALLWVPLLPEWWLVVPVWLAARCVAWQITPPENGSAATTAESSDESA